MKRPANPMPTIILDFDETLVDKDSSEWVARQLGAASLFDDLRLGQGVPWHQAMNTVLRTLHSQGTTIEHIRQALSLLPFPCETVNVFKAAHSLGCQLRILSDANTFFIESVLAYHGLDALFTSIHSNPAWVDASGCLCYSAFHGDMLPPHNCPLCPPNMCKGSILDRIRATSYDPAVLQIIYAGDGIGDFCPSLRLIKRDYVLPRQEYPLLRLLEEQHVEASVRPWNSLATTLQGSLLECFKCSGFDVVDEPLSSWSGLSSLMGQDDNNTFGRCAIASGSQFRTKFHDVYEAAFPIRRSPFLKHWSTKFLFAHCCSRKVTACLRMNSEQSTWRIQAGASLVWIVSGRASQSPRISCSPLYIGVCEGVNQTPYKMHTWAKRCEMFKPGCVVSDCTAAGILH